MVEIPKSRIMKKKAGRVIVVVVFCIALVFAADRLLFEVSVAERRLCFVPIVKTYDTERPTFEMHLTMGAVNGMKLVNKRIVNNSDAWHTLGRMYGLYSWYGGRWQASIGDIHPVDIHVLVAPRSFTVRPMCFYTNFGHLPPGRHLITEELSPFDNHYTFEVIGRSIVVESRFDIVYCHPPSFIRRLLSECSH